ncbi:hypothetical protein [Heliomicrobium undosum]|uniref:hypothetical protein n=1 Tax=Heliomicrobium undosum TaxID=121734 RepID=UPI001A9B07BD|nr:hypothetical protein [Heliomicrobium undosum]
MYEGMFSPDRNYKLVFEAAVTELVKRKLPVPWRIKTVDDLLEAYVSQVGEVPDGIQLERLANFILKDSTNRPDKVSHEEYPAMNEDQLKVRQWREIPFEFIGKAPSDVKRLGIRLKSRKHDITKQPNKKRIA